MAVSFWIHIILTTIISRGSMQIQGESYQVTINREVKLDLASSININGFQTFLPNKGSQINSLRVPLDSRYKREQANIVITQHFNERLASPGEHVSLQCTGNSDRPPRFIWERDGVVISSNTDHRYIINQIMSPTSMGVITQLNISNARVEDGGLYACVAVVAETSVSHVARLDVYGPPYIRNLPPIKVQNGESLNLRCPYYGYPISKLDWEHKGKKIASSNLSQHTRYKRNYNMRRKRKKRQVVLSTNEYGTLLIPRVLKEEQPGGFVCIVYSPTGEMARRSFEIQVVEAPELDELRVGSGLKEGQIVQITCNIISGDPPIYFSWLKDGKKIPPNLKVVERSSELFSVLIIKKVSLEHCGLYSCIASNHVGRHNRTASLYINVAPKWVTEPKNTSVLVGHRGVTHCHANGYPTPQIHWMKRDDILGIWRPVLDLAGGGIMSVPNGTLVIEVVSLSDEGMYSCNVENGVGEPLNKNIWITVNKPVYFDSLSSNITTKIGYPVQLVCQPRGDHPIRVKWILDGKQVDFTTSRIKVSETLTDTGLKNIIDISYAEGRDAGAYECRASNPHGVAEHYFYLNILEPPAPPIDLLVESVWSRRAKLSWQSATNRHSHYYTVQYSGSRGKWELAAQLNITRDDTDLRESIILKDLHPNTEYFVRVAAGNEADLSEFTRPVHLTTLQEAPTSSPISIEVQITDQPGELQLYWSPPPLDTRNGVIQGYNIKTELSNVLRNKDPEDSVKITKVASKEGRQESLLRGLMKNTLYCVSINAYNEAGNGPFSLPVCQTTREGAPEESPSSVTCTAVSSTSVRVWWQTIQTQNHGGALTGFTILYSAEGDNWQNITSLQTEVYLQSLLKYTNYSIKVAAHSSYGIGPYSLPISCTTLQDVPGPPDAIKVLVTSPSSMLVTWTKPQHPNGILTHFTLYSKPSTSNVSPNEYKISVREMDQTRYYRFELKNLVRSPQYGISVSASTDAGEGPSTEVVNRDLSTKVIAGIASIGGNIFVSAGRSVLLQCECVGSPPPRSVWYHNHNILTHHPRYTRNHDDSLLINNVDISLSGNYTCLAKNLYGSDAVSYIVKVLSAPEPPVVRASSTTDSILVEWDPNTTHDAYKQRIHYNISWKEADGLWLNTWSISQLDEDATFKHRISGLKCGTRYTVRLVAINTVGASTPSYVHMATQGGVPSPPTSVEWFWSNSTHIYIQLSAWRENLCPIINWEVEYRSLTGNHWRKATNKIQKNPTWDYSGITTHPSSFVIGDLDMAKWYQIRVTATTEAGNSTTLYNYATTTETGESIGLPSDYLDLNLLVIICSSVLLVLCFAACIYILLKKHQHDRQTEYRNSLTAECKSDSGNLTVDNCNSSSKESRIYSAPIHIQDNKHELYEISPYAQFSLGFRTFGHVENQEPPLQLRPTASSTKYHSETSFHARSESDESDCISHTATLKTAPRKACRIPHHR